MADVDEPPIGGAAPVTAEDRAIGALIGLAAGDAVGTTLEFRRPGTFEPITDMVGGGPFGLVPGAWTDDTSMALCLAESILDTGALDLADQMRRYVLWHEEGYLSSTGRCFDIGTTTTQQLARFVRTGEPVDPHPDDDAAANGSLMRLAPVAIRWHTDLEQVIHQAAESSLPTHAASRPVDACKVLGAMTAALIHGQPANEVLSPAFWRFGSLHPEVAAVAAGSWQHREPPDIKGSGYCVAALEAALWAVAGASSFAEAVLRAANLGDDADTTAAIAGQLAGARWGMSGIPNAWVDRLVLRERIVELASRLFVAGGGEPTAPPRWPHDELLHAWWVEPGAVLAGEYPAARGDRGTTTAKVNLLVDAGMRTFIDLTTAEDRLDPYADVLAATARARRLDLRHVNVPIPDLGVVHDDEYLRLVELIDGHRPRGGTYLHCWGGVGRTGTVVGHLLLSQGHDYDTAVETLRTLRAGTRKAARSCPQTDVQHAVLRRAAGAAPRR
jgi:ADP-ribosyl-[dinitrogen reductase] hydrolase